MKKLNAAEGPHNGKSTNICFQLLFLFFSCSVVSVQHFSHVLTLHHRFQKVKRVVNTSKASTTLAGKGTAFLTSMHGGPDVDNGGRGT